MLLSVAAVLLAAVGQFEGHGDVGAPKLAGSATYNAATQEYALTRRRHEHVGAARRVPLRLEAHDAATSSCRRASSSSAAASTRTASSASSCAAASTPTRPTPTWPCHGDGLTSLQFRRTKGAVTEQVESAVKGADVVQLERKGNDVHDVGRALRRAVHGERGRRTWRSATRSTSGLFLCSHNPDVVEQRGLPQRARHPAGQGRLRALPRLHRQPPRGPGRRERAPPGRALARRRARSRRPTGRRTATRSSTTRAAAAKGGAVSTASTWRRASRRSSTPASRTATTTTTCSRSTGRMLAISDQSAGRRTVDGLHGAGRRAARRSASRRSRRRTCTAGRPTAKSLVYTGGRDDEYDIYAIPSDGSGPEVKLTEFKGLDDGPEYSPDGKHDLLQLDAQRAHADLAHERRRIERAAGHERRVQQLVPALLARREVDRVHQLRPGRAARRPPVLQARAAAPDAGRGRARRG